MTGARVGLHGAGQDPDERALARAVFADQRVHFAGAQIEGNMLQRAHAAVAFFDSARLQQYVRQPAIILGRQYCD